MQIPQNCWFIMNHPIKMDDDWGVLYFRKPPNHLSPISFLVNSSLSHFPFEQCDLRPWLVDDWFRDLSEIHWGMITIREVGIPISQPV